MTQTGTSTSATLAPAAHPLAILPLVYAVRRTGSIRVGITAHIMVNGVDLVVLCAVLLTA